MKKNTQYIIILALTLVQFSCGKFLEVQPRDNVSDEQTIYDKASSETALRGVYSALASSDYYGTSFQSIGYLSGDNIQWTGSQSQIQDFINHNVNSQNGTLNSAWTAIYTTINRANNVIASVPEVTDALLTSELKNQLVGEAYFIRALAYFDLARTWGGAPLITKPTVKATDNRGIPRSSQSETYAQALNDLDAAESLLTETTVRYRATKKTVWALKARYYLYQSDWENAEAYASKLIEDTNYELLKPYSAFFANNAQGTRESVFEIFYSSDEPNTHSTSWQPQEKGGTRQWAPNETIAALLTNPLIGGGRSALVAKDNQGRWYGNLYYRTNPATDPSFVIRIAELYLIRAEARAHQSGTKIAEAIADLNTIRTRASVAATTATTANDVLLAIENERRLEFALEPHRWYDLVRTGRAAAVLNITDPNRFLMPIPANQILIDNALLPNNPGY